MAVADCGHSVEAVIATGEVSLPEGNKAGSVNCFGNRFTASDRGLAGTLLAILAAGGRAQQQGQGQKANQKTSGMHQAKLRLAKPGRAWIYLTRHARSEDQGQDERQEEKGNQPAEVIDNKTGPGKDSQKRAAGKQNHRYRNRQQKKESVDSLSGIHTLRTSGKTTVRTWGFRIPHAVKVNQLA